MKYYILVEGDLLEADTKYIAHQCNCVTSVGANLSKAVFNRFPFADIYASRANYDREELPLPGQEPGNIIIRGNGNDQRFVINMIGQWYPGEAKYINSTKDGLIARQNYFKNCLLKIMEIPDLESIAFPYQIGCGMAGGDWDIYEQLLNIFAKKTDADVFIYQLKRDDEND